MVLTADAAALVPGSAGPLQVAGAQRVPPPPLFFFPFLYGTVPGVSVPLSSAGGSRRRFTGAALHWHSLSILLPLSSLELLLLQDIQLEDLLDRWPLCYRMCGLAVAQLPIAVADPDGPSAAKRLTAWFALSWPLHISV